MQVLQLLFTKIYIAALIFEFFNSDKTKYIVQIMKCKLLIKTTENERGNWGLEFGLTEMCSLLISRAWDARETLFIL